MENRKLHPHKIGEWFIDGEAFLTDIHTDVTYKRKGSFAAHCVDYSSCHEMILHHHYNGGEPQAFGGAEHWPVVSLKVAFNVDEYEKQRRFAETLALFVDKFLAKEPSDGDKADGK